MHVRVPLHIMHKHADTITHTHTQAYIHHHIHECRVHSLQVQGVHLQANPGLFAHSRQPA